MDKYAKVERLLSNYKMMKIGIINMEQEIEYLKQDDGVKGIGFDSISTSPTNQTSDIVANTVIARSEKIHYLERIIERNKKDIERLDRALEGLEEVERVVVIEKYVNAKQWWQVASEVRYGERHCRRLKTQAINKMKVGIFG